MAHESFDDIPTLARDLQVMLQNSEKAVIATHARVDADAVGSVVATAALCRALGVEPTATRCGDFLLPDSLDFLNVDGELTNDCIDPIVDADLIVFVDCADANRAGQVSEILAERQLSYRSINIDHHVTNTRFGDLDIVIPQAAATSEILVEIFEELEIPFTPEIATAMLAGIYGDTLGLKTPSTRPHTMRACADLVEAHAHLDLIVDRLFRKKPFSTIHLWGEAQSRAAWHGRLVWSIVTSDMLERAEAESSQTEGLVNFLAGAEGAFAAALIQESEDGWRVSLRSTTEAVDVAKLASHFGGGGHPRAAGLRLEPGREAVDEFLDYVASELDKLPADAGTRPDYASTLAG
jgi:phosphoesterase RecJ-like protein